MSRTRTLLLYALICFCTALAACWLQYTLSSGRGETNLVLVFDSGHYQETANLLCKAIEHGLSGGKEKEALARALMLDGPILPGLAAFAFLSLGRIFSAPDWASLLILQAGLHALSAVLVFLLGRQFLAPSWKWPLAAGLLWAVNPIAVLSTQRFLAENLVADFLLLLLLVSGKWVRACGQAASGWACAFGFLTALIVFAKAALLPGILLVLAAVVVTKWRQLCKSAEKRNKLSAFASCGAGVLIGLALVVLPWACFTHDASGKYQLFPQRAPTLNLFVGWNFETHGFSTLPVAPVPAQLSEASQRTGSAPGAVLTLWLAKPADCAALAVQKISRLYGLPWNDFRRSGLGFSPPMQRLLFQISLALALFAFCFLVAFKGPPIMWMSALLIAGHLIFLLFETVPRYAFSSYPLIFLFACSSLFPWLELEREHRKVLYTLVALLLMVALPIALIGLEIPLNYLAQFPSPDRFFSLSLLAIALAVLSVTGLIGVPLLRAKGAPLTVEQKRSFVFALVWVTFIYGIVQMFYAMGAPERGEWKVKLGPGQEAERDFDLPASAAGASSYLLVIDGVQQVNDCLLKVNGQSLPSHAANLFDYMPARREHFQFAEQVAAFMGRNIADVRRWWAVPVPAGLLAPGKQNKVVLKVPAGASARLYGEGTDKTEAFNRPGYLYISPGKIWTSNNSLEWREGKPLGQFGQKGECFISSPDGRKERRPGNLRMFILSGKERDIARSLETAAFQLY